MPPFLQICQGGNFCLLIGLKNTNLVEYVEIVLPVKFRWILFSSFRGGVENVSANQTPRRQSCFPIGSKNKNLEEDVEIWSCFLSSFVEFHSAVSEEKSKMSQPMRGQGGHLVFPIGPKNTNLVEAVKILPRVNFGWIPFSGFREVVENVSANQTPGRPSCFSYRPEKHKLRRGRWDVASCQVSLNSIQRIQRRSRKWLSQSEAGAAIFVFPIGPKKKTGQRKLRSCFLSSFVESRSAVLEKRKSRKCEKLTTDGKTTDDAWSQ